MSKYKVFFHGNRIIEADSHEEAMEKAMDEDFCSEEFEVDGTIKLEDGDWDDEE